LKEETSAMSIRGSAPLLVSVVTVAILGHGSPVIAASTAVGPAHPHSSTDASSGLQLAQGTMDFDTPDFRLSLVKDSQTIAALRPKNAGEFDFTPSDLLKARSANGYHHLGDIILRVREGDAGEWKEYSTSTDRHPVTALPASGNTLAAADLSPTLPNDCPVRVIRSWVIVDGHLALTFRLENRTAGPIQIGGLAIPMVFNNIITDRTLEQAHAVCSFSDPYIGQDAGYLQVTRLSGQGPALVVVPDGDTPFEAYEPLDEPMWKNQTFEGMLAWTVHSRAYADTDWKGVQPWNPPTMVTVPPAGSRTYGLKFLLSDSIRHIDKTLEANKRPVAIGIPGYVLPEDQDGRLFLKYPHPVKSISVVPAGAIEVKRLHPARNDWKAYAVHGRKWGRARLTVVYDDGLTESISYYVTKPAAQAVSDMGRFLTTKQWFVDPSDPFHRSPSPISYDREADKQVTQDSRVWIAGLGDEGGSGSYIATAMKLFGQPDHAEVAKYEQFIDQVLWGHIQYKDGPNKYGVRKSIFYYDPKDVPGFTYDPSLNWTTWTSWNKEASEDVGRGYNYPHIVIAYWAMYRIARNHPGLVTNHPWQWYLDQAYQTTRFVTEKDANGEYKVGYIDLGLMEGDVFLKLLEDLKREGWTPQAEDIEARMKARADHWKTMPYPFGSEMAWDSTGQEEVYAWSKYFGYTPQAEETLDAILGYMPTLPHWGYNGNARRYWDFLYGGKLSRIERQLHHYGSGLNAIPVLSEYRSHPDDYYLLRVGYGGTMGPLSNIDQDGFASAAFHSYPSTLKWDAYSGDYGPNFFGHAIDTATYVIDHPDFGWQAFGGNVSTHGHEVAVEPKDSFRKRVYIAPYGLWLTLDAGTFSSIAIDVDKHVVRVSLSPAALYTPDARLRVEQPAKRPGIGTFAPVREYVVDAGAYTIPLGHGVTSVELAVR
jgi:hypothetical protein